MKFYRENFISIREAKRMSQTELADKLGVSQQSVQQWESGATRPRPKKVYAAAKALGVSAVDISDLKPEEWLTGENPNATNDPLLQIVLDAWPTLNAEDRGRVAGIVCGMVDAAPPPSAVTPGKCPKCGEALPADWKIGEKNACPHCGQHIKLVP